MGLCVLLSGACGGAKGFTDSDSFHSYCRHRTALVNAQTDWDANASTLGAYRSAVIAAQTGIADDAKAAQSQGHSTDAQTMRKVASAREPADALTLSSELPSC